MSTSGTGQQVSDRAQIEADIATTRAALGNTVESLGHKLDVKERARRGAAEAGRRVQHEAADRASAAIDRVRDRPALPVAVVAVALVGLAVVLWRRRR